MSDLIFDYKRFSALAARVAAEGCVLLENENRTLPLAKGGKIALFGRALYNYYKSGTGSGGMVNVNHVVDLPEALAKDGLYELNKEVDETYREWLKEHPYDDGIGWGNEPWFQEEMPLTDELVSRAAEESDTAIIVLGRTAGEDHDNAAEPGSYLPTAAEEDVLRKVCGAFKKSVVLLNISNIIDMKWVKKYHPSAVMIIWQGGEAGCLGVADVLSGKESPSGRLPDTIAWDIADYPSTKYFGDPVRNIYHEDIYVGYRYFETFCPEKAAYPFGYGLSYTTFDIETAAFSWDGTAEGCLSLTARVTNTGDTAGRETVMLFAEKPQGKLGQPVRSLIGFAKTEVLAPGGSEELVISADPYLFASYDDDGRTGFTSAYVLEAGTYVFHAGCDVRHTKTAGEVTLKKTLLVRQLAEAEAPIAEAMRLVPRFEGGHFSENEEPMPLRTVSPLAKREKWLPEGTSSAGDLGWKLKDVADGKVSMEVFISQLSDKELCQILRGEGMNSPKVTPGTGGAIGGVTEALKNYGIPVGCCSDGPSGIRMDCGTRAFAMPNGTMMASTFNTDLIREIYEFEGLELRKNKIDLLLGPGLNIHRSPLNGRNFEYFSEDPLLTGRMAVSQLQGMQAYGVSGVIKHFAGNNQEWKRHSVDAVVSERALREIYLKAFELAVKEGGAMAVMSTYGRLNGTYTSSSYDLLTTILREEWGFDGIVMTDWWASFSPVELIEEEPCQDLPDEAGLTDDLMAGNITDFSTMVRAQNDLYMVVPDGENPGHSRAYSQDYAGKYVSETQAKTLGISRDPRFRGTLPEAVSRGRLTRGELLRSAGNICRFALKSEAMRRLCAEGTAVEVVHAPQDEKLDAVAVVSFEKILPEGMSVNLSDLPCERGDSSLLGFEMEPGSYYTFAFEGTCTAAGVAQVPVTFFFTKIPLAVLVWSGTGGRTVTKRVRFLATMRSNVFRIYFGESGVRLTRMTVTKDGPGQDRKLGLITGES